MLFLVFIVLLVAPATLACSSGERSFSIVNNCNYKVWAAAISQDGGDGWEMAPGANSEKCISSSWSGRIWPRTNCHFGSNGLCSPPTSQCCSTGNCINGEDQFALKCIHSGVPPVTVAEFTLGGYGSVDWYDVSLVDGASIPVEIIPKPGTYNQLPGDNYSCGSPGCTTSTCPSVNPLGTCSWKYNAGSYSPQMQMVEPTQCTSNTDCASGSCNTATKTCSCTTDANCHAGEVCGKRLIPGVGVVSACGASIGYFSANTICSLDTSLGAPLSCSQAVPGQGTHMNLFGCTGPNAGSCYTNGADANCCGCPSWSPSGKCQNSNPQWETIAKPTVAIFKDACPTAYSFPYDDITSTFTCGGASTTNLPQYTITFCPAGSPGSLSSSLRSSNETQPSTGVATTDETSKKDTVSQPTPATRTQS